MSAIKDGKVLLACMAQPHKLHSNNLGRFVSVLMIEAVFDGELVEHPPKYFHFRLTNGLETLTKGGQASGHFLTQFREPAENFDSYFSDLEGIAELS